MSGNGDTENVAAITIGEGIRADDLDAFLHVFRSFDWVPRLSLPDNLGSVRSPSLTFSTSDGTVLHISKNSSGNFDLRFGFEDPQHPDERLDSKFDGAAVTDVENTIRVFCSDSIEKKREWANTTLRAVITFLFCIC
jgi:hypothetical protein